MHGGLWNLGSRKNELGACSACKGVRISIIGEFIHIGDFQEDFDFEGLYIKVTKKAFVIKTGEDIINYSTFETKESN